MEVKIDIYFYIFLSTMFEKKEFLILSITEKLHVTHSRKFTYPFFLKDRLDILSFSCDKNTSLIKKEWKIFKNHTFSVKTKSLKNRIKKV